ncbi:hypothetical protein [uncultured Dechloromonas sp.]|uniref:hypothetical protein n=1 Tax=uncultured Dechloromonas sp. TaxID=171719 RepID=UPI0025D867F4|nr:hypothetical protein [uncultured Dechloromonas sp.]
MNKNICEKSAYQIAFQRWFSRYEVERRRQKKAKHARLIGFPEAPTHPAEIAHVVDQLGASTVIRVLEVHRSTLARWLAGTCVIPRSAWLVLVMLAEGRLPGMSEDWQDWRFVGDRLHLIGTRLSYSAREIAGWQYQVAYAEALGRRVKELEQHRDYLLRIGVFEAANDAIAV